MSQVSKYPITKNVYDRILQVFYKSIIELNNDKQISAFFEEFLSPTEKIMLAKRFAIAFLLAKKYSYRDINKVLRVSATTIARVSLSYNYGDYFKNIVDNILKDEEISEYWSGVGEKVTSILSSGGSKGASWKYLRDELRIKRLKKPF